MSLVNISDRAASRMAELAAMHGCSPRVVRIYAEREGCGSPEFGMSFDAQRGEDQVENAKGVTLVIDPESARVVGRLDIDYVEAEGREKFTFTQAATETQSCGCSH